MVRVIEEHPFFHNADPRHLRILAAFAMITKYAAGDRIFNQGDTAHSFYALQKGNVELVVEGSGESVDVIGAGDVLGWSWLFSPYRWQFTAIALEPVEAIFFYGPPLRERCAVNHSLGYDLMPRHQFH